MKSATIRNISSRLIFSFLSKSKEGFRTMRNSGGQTAKSPILAELDVHGLHACTTLSHVEFVLTAYLQ